MNTHYSLFIRFGVLFLFGLDLAAQGLNSGGVSEQIASHFEQVFSSQSPGDRESWLPGNEAKPPLFDVEIEWGASYTAVAPTGVENSDSEVTLSHAEVSYALTYPYRPGKRIGWVVGFENFYLHESRYGDSPSFEFDHIRQLNSAFIYTTNLSPRWDLFAGVGGVHSDGNGPRHRDSYVFLTFLGGSFTVNPNLTISLGMMISSNENYHHQDLPMFVIDWQIDDSNRLSIRNGIFYQHALTSDWKSVIGASIEGYAISVDENDFERSGRWFHSSTRCNSDLSVNLLYNRRFAKGWLLETKVGLHLAESALYDGDDQVYSVEMDPALGASLGLSYKF